MDSTVSHQAKASENRKIPACDVEALKKCLEENKGDYFKCQSQIEAFRSSCSLNKPTTQTQDSPTKYQ